MNDLRERRAGDAGTVFAFPGQGSFDVEVLHQLLTGFPTVAPWFEAADAAARRRLGEPFLPIVDAGTPAERQARAEAAPELQQLGIFLAGVALFQLLEEGGARPGLLLGHSFGELAALAAAGVFDRATGVDVVCDRVLALRAVSVAGGLAALSCGAERAEELLRLFGNSALVVAVVNHSRQTVVSGPREELERLVAYLAAQAVSATVLSSRYPFHSPHLAPAVDRFATALRRRRLAPARFPVFLAMEQRSYGPELDLPRLLASQLTRRLDFAAALGTVRAAGFTRFVEVGAGEIVGRLVARCFPAGAAPGEDVVATSVAPPGEPVADGLARTLRALGLEGASARHSGAGARAARAASLDEVTVLLRDAADRVAGAAKLLRAEGSAAIAPDGPPAAAPLQAPSHSVPATTADAPAGRLPQPPIAIVAMGCVLPGARDAEEYWHNVLEGVSGIVDLAALDPGLARDFVARAGADPPETVPDKTYTLLSGAVRDVAYEPSLLGRWYDVASFAGLTRGQKMLAAALAQTVATLPEDRAGGAGVQVILGATADGSSEHDEALFVADARRRLGELDLADGLRRRLDGCLATLPGFCTRAPEELRQHELYRTVVATLLGTPAPTYVVDAACSSSLYAVALAMDALASGEADLAIAGGVFAAGPANNTLFAQFRGLTPHGSRPLDAAADGVVFGDGAAVVALQRLPDALAAGVPVLGVLRAIGLASDGKAPSLNVPQSAGQSLAIRRAYEASGIAPDTVQLVEAHATATPVGDAVELRSLSEVFAGRDATLPRIQLGSVKSLIGHTGWVSGVASLIKVLKAFGERTVPPQHHFDAPDPALGLDASPFEITRGARPWPRNVPPHPRRAGIDGFGFGGTDAHLVVEELDEAYHRSLCRDVPIPCVRTSELAVVGVASLFPTDDDVADSPGAEARFRRTALRLPAGKRLLPDVTDHMDASQFLAAMAAERLLAALPGALRERGDAIGVVLGLEGKTERGGSANQRIFLDRALRVLGERGDADAREEGGALAALASRIRDRVLPSGPYTLPGLMPNLAASRVSNLFALRGPNLVVDCGSGSLLQALAAARSLLDRGGCEVVLAGGLAASARVRVSGGDRASDGDREGVLMVALVTPETAAAHALPVLARLSVSAAAGERSPAAAPRVVVADRRWGGAGAIVEVLAALRAAEGSAAATSVESPSFPGRRLLVRGATARGPERGDAEAVGTPAPGAPRGAAASVTADPATAASSTAISSLAPFGTHAYVQGTPIATYTPVLIAAPPVPEAASLRDRRLLVLVEQADLWRELAASPAFRGVRYTTLCPAGAPVPGALTVDPERAAEDGELRALLRDHDAVVVVRRAVAGDTPSLLTAPLAESTRLLDLLFAVCQAGYAELGAGGLGVYALSLGACTGEGALALDPTAGLFGGFLKSLARELPALVARNVAADVVAAAAAPALLAGELACGAGEPVEVCWRSGRRFQVVLAPVDRLTLPGSAPLLDARSVVLASGGARGVTAVLAEELLERFGCTVVALGRTDAAALPPELAALDESELAEGESRFYRDELARDATQRIPDLKRRFAAHQAAHELATVTRRLAALPGRFEYKTLDLLDEAAVERVVDEVLRRHGRLDLVVHGAGVQVSKVLPKKSLADFRRIVATKLGGLGSIHRACRRRAPARPVHFHLLSSAFSYLGNDGQPDYGAANEAMNWLAATMDGRDGAAWSSLAWLGWAGIGMTRGSEFAALAANRRLRGVTRGEGREIFARAVAGRPAAPVTVLLAAGERDFYGPAIAAAPAATPEPQPAGKAEAREVTVGWPASPATTSAPPSAPVAPVALMRPLAIELGSAPYLRDHLVHGVPTLPGALLIGIAAEAAASLRPGLRIVAFEDTSFRRFVRVYEGRATELRVDTRVVDEREDEAVMRVQVLADFVHKSGAVLQTDVVQTEIFVRMAASPPAGPARGDVGASSDGVELPDPYLLEGSPVRLNGRFQSLRGLRVAAQSRFAQYRLNGSTYPLSPLQHLLPNVILVDAFWRFGTIMPNGGRSLAVYVPERCDRMRVFFDYTDFDLGWLHEPVLFTGANPRPCGDQLEVGPIEAWDHQGRLRLTVEGGVCRKFGEVHDAY
jgi:acyl transferase domain-containing protein/NAD(P)-dependent dehydrogenase (short-subunit alcohol dehydrogenase family)